MPDDGPSDGGGDDGQLPELVEDLEMSTMITDFFKTEVPLTLTYVVGLLVATVLSLVVITKLTASIYNAIAAGDSDGSMRIFFWLAAAMVGLIAVNYGVDAAEAHLMPKYEAFVHKQMANRIVAHNDREFLDVEPIKYRQAVSTCKRSSQTVYSSLIQTYIPNIVLLAVLVCFMFAIDVAFVGVFAVAATAAAGLFMLNKPSIKEKSIDLEQQTRMVEADIFDVYTSMDTVVTHNEARRELRELNAKLDGVAEQSKDFYMHVNGFTYFTYFIMTAAIGTCMWLSLRKVKSDNTKAQVTSIVLAFALMVMLRGKMRGQAGANTQMMQESGRYNAVQIDALQPKPALMEVVEEGGSTGRTAAAAALDVQKLFLREQPVIECRNVRFKYKPRPSFRGMDGGGGGAHKGQVESKGADPEDGGQFIVDDFSWDVHAGCNGLFGGSGTGKSSIGRLLVGLYPDYRGSIKIEGRELRDIPRTELRNMVRLSQQKMNPKNTTIREMLQFGNDHLRERDIASAWSKIKHMYSPMTLDSNINVAGKNLSTGQLQMLRMTAMQMARQPILILDEPASGIDVAHRTGVHQTIAQLSQEKVVIIITHDKETATLAGSQIKRLHPRKIVN